MTERLLEIKLITAVKRLGGMALKFTSPSFSGVPDRLVLMPGGKVFFAEVKRPGGKLSDRQKSVMSALGALSLTVVVIDSEETLEAFIELIKTTKTPR